MGLHIWELLLIFLVVLVLFGAGKIPRLAEDMGKGIRAFKKGLKEDEPSEVHPAGPEKIEKDRENADEAE